MKTQHRAHSDVACQAPWLRGRWGWAERAAEAHALLRRLALVQACRCCRARW